MLLSLSLKSPGLKAVQHSCSPSPNQLLMQPSPFGFGLVDEVDGTTSRPMTADLSPTTVLSRLSFEAVDAQVGANEESRNVCLMHWCLSGSIRENNITDRSGSECRRRRLCHPARAAITTAPRKRWK